jgi:hypothetical protein
VHEFVDVEIGIGIEKLRTSQFALAVPYLAADIPVRI